MENRICKLNFLSEIHIGQNSLADSEYTIPADTLYSALCIEALQKEGEDGIEKLNQGAKTGSLIISDALPFMGNTYFVAKPTIHINKVTKGATAKSGSKDKKMFKRLKYIPMDDFEAFLAGQLNPRESLEKLRNLGSSDLRTKVTISTAGEDTVPYSVGTYRFAEDAGLYILLRGTKEYLDYTEELLQGLGYSGVGGKRSSGYGKFRMEKGCLPESFAQRLEEKYNKYCTLSVCLPMEEEMLGVIAGAEFVVKKRSGFVQSTTYSDEVVRKKDMYVLGAGSTFNQKFKGDVYDVSFKGKHPVYRYAIPLFVGVS